MAVKKKEDFSELITYMNKLSSRISEVENQSKIILNEIAKRDNSLEHSISSVKTDIDYLKKSIAAAKEITERQKNIIKVFVKEFKGIAKEESFKRLKEKIDEWGPERFITRKELKKKI